MTPLTRHINKIKRNIQKGKNNINKNTEEIEERKQQYPKIQGRIPKKEHIQNISKPKTQKQARQRFNTIHNRRKQLHHIFITFLEKMKKDLDILINHIGNKRIPSTNNLVKNYYRTTLPQCHKRIYRTLQGLKRRIKEQQIQWTHRQVLKQKTNNNKNTTYNQKITI